MILMSRRNQQVPYVVKLLMTQACTLASPTIFTTLRRPSPPCSAAMTAAAVDPSNLDSIFHQKKLLRNKVKKELRQMDPTSRIQQDDAIQRVVLEAPWFKSCQRLCAYISCAALREVDTSKILAEILKEPSKDGDSRMRKMLYVPRVEDKNRNMRMLHISKIDDLIANSMNILEPHPVDADGKEREEVMSSKEPVDLFLLPGLAFDKSGRRLGRGGGYYDTFLERYQELAKRQNWKQPLLIALSYSEQIMDEGVIPTTPNDVPIDALVLPSGVISMSEAFRQSCE
ncbi:ligase [Lithospermum erythrorhizon]|uniref:5-formyltetrahydrofolate cyclo-ligase n=1 Tax=Lithospermum erythrorhizon TaxID=34254 RepID=A0AAV3QED4_LITER